MDRCRRGRPSDQRDRHHLSDPLDLSHRPVPRPWKPHRLVLLDLYHRPGQGLPDRPSGRLVPAPLADLGDRCRLAGRELLKRRRSDPCRRGRLEGQSVPSARPGRAPRCRPSLPRDLGRPSRRSGLADLRRQPLPQFRRRPGGRSRPRLQSRLSALSSQRARMGPPDQRDPPDLSGRGHPPRRCLTVLADLRHPVCREDPPGPSRRAGLAHQESQEAQDHLADQSDQQAQGRPARLPVPERRPRQRGQQSQRDQQDRGRPR